MSHETQTDDFPLLLEANPSTRHRGTASIVATDYDLVAYAGKPLLSSGEAIALIQGFKPPVPRFDDERVYYLEAYADSAQRLLRDAEAGVLPMPCRPVEFLAWARAIGIELPPMFCTCVDGADAGATASQLAGRGTSAVAAAEDQGELNQRNQELQRQADKVAISWRQGHPRWPTKQEVAKIVATRFALSPERAERLLRNTWKPSRRSRRTE